MKRVAGLIALVFVLCSSPLFAATLYVDKGSPVAVAPYSSWATAAHGIQTAINRAAAGDTIIVGGAGGTLVYSGYNADPEGGYNVVVLTKNVSVVGAGNPIIDGLGQASGVYMTAGNLFGFTIRNASTNYDGVGARISGGSLSNCVVVSNRWTGIDLHNTGSAVNCLVAHNNSGVDFDGGNLINCTVVRNGIGLYMIKEYAAVFNCIAWSNNVNYHYRTDDLDRTFGVTYFYNNCTTPAYAGPGTVNGNIASNPNFLNPAAGNYRLGASSCVNGGWPSPGLGYGPVDLDGNPRAVGLPDIGCYEKQPRPEPASDAYEPDNSSSAAKPIANGQTQNRTLASGDADWAKFTVGPGGASNVRLTAGSAASDTYADLWLYDGNLQVLASDFSAWGTLATITVASLPAGTYYVRFEGSVFDAYTLNASWMAAAPTPDAYEFDGHATTAKAISNGQTQNHTMHVAGDVDWVKFTVGAAGAANVRVETSGASGDTHMWLFGPNSSSTLVAYDNDSGTGNFSLIAKATLAPGTYYLGLREYGDNATIAAYSVKASWTTPSAPAGDAYEFDGHATMAKAIANGQTQNHSMHVAGDVDWVKFTIGAAGAANVLLETAGASGDTHMWLFGPNNASTLVAYNDDRGGGNLFSLISQATLAPGTYYLGIREYGDNATIAAYTVKASWTAPTVPVGDAYEFDGYATLAKPIVIGQTQTHSILPAGEVDWVKFTVGIPGVSNMRLETAGASGDTQMWLFGPNNASTLVAYNDDKGSGSYFSLITIASLAPGTYYIGIREYGDNGIIPAYTLQVGGISP